MKNENSPERPGDLTLEQQLLLRIHRDNMETAITNAINNAAIEGVSLTVRDFAPFVAASLDAVAFAFTKENWCKEELKKHWNL